MKKKFKVRHLLLVLGALLSAYALVSLLCAEDMWVYATCAPDVQKNAATSAEDGNGSATASADTGLEELIRQRDSVAEKLGDEARAVACSGRTLNAEINSGRTVEGQISLYAVDVCWMEVHPRRMLQGRWMDNHELRAGERVAVLDRNTAFALFGTEDCIGGRFMIAEAEYRVIGVTKRRAGLGEPAENCVYIPLLAAAEQGLQLESLELSALPANGDSLGMNFESAAQEAWGDGSFYCTRKEVMRHTMLLRWIVFFAGVALLAEGFRVYRRRVSSQIAVIRELCEKRYLVQVLGTVMLRIIMMTLGAAALLGVLYGVLTFMIQPVYTFTEWVPESLVEISKYRAVFWNLVRGASGAVSVQTAEIARLRLNGKFLNWGCILLLLALAGSAIRLPRRKKMEN